VEAARLLERGCDDPSLADPQACLALGVMYFKGQGVPQDPQKAMGLLRRGAPRVSPMALSPSNGC
jgi:TPR repeat protein